MDKRTLLSGASTLLAALTAILLLWPVDKDGHNETLPPATQWPRHTMPTEPAPPAWSADAERTAAEKPDPTRLFNIGFAGGIVLNQDTVASLHQIVIWTSGESPTMTMGEVERSLRRSFTPEDATRALDLIGRYRNYMAEYQIGANPIEMPHSMAQAEAFLAQRGQLRRSHFGDIAHKELFADEDSHDRRMFQAMFSARTQTLESVDKTREN